MPYPLPLTRTEAYLAYKAGVIQQSDLKPSLAVPRNGIDAWLAYWTGLAADYPKREDGTPHILQEEEAYIAYLCGVINEYPEKCLRRVGAYLRYLISARWGRPDHPLNREELYLSLIKTQFIPSGDPSSDIVIDGTAKAPFVDVKMYGDTYQQTYTGKNLLGLKKPSSNTFGFEPAVAEESGTITVDGTFTGGGGGFPWISDRQLSIPAGTYTFSMKNPQSFNVSLRMFDAQGQYTSGKYIAAGATSGTFTLEYDCVRVAVLIGAFSAGKTLNNQKFEELQLEAGSTATSFEPYVGGQPSPSPDYPQQIQTVTGLQTVTVIGKNLLKLNDGATTLGGVPITVVNGTVNLNGTATSFAQGYYVPINITASESMVFSPNRKGATSGLDVKLQYKRGEAIYYPSVGSSLSLQAGDIIQQMYLIVSNGSALNGSFSPMLEKGSTATSYVPYSSTDYPISLGSIELCKLGTYQDYIYKDGNDWKVHKATNKAILDGSESWLGSGTTNVQYTTKITDYATSGNVPFSASFAGRTNVSGAYLVTGDNTIAFINRNDIYRLYIKSAGVASSQTAVKNWLLNHNTTVYYALATPTDTTITDTDLIAQLEALVAGGAENGTTYIKVNATDPNLPGLLYVEAPKYE